MATETKTCQNCKVPFIIEPDDFSFYEKIKVPPPTWCPECRLVRRLSFRNERHLYKRKCELCQKDILSMYAPDVKRKVFCPACWWSDNWDPGESAMEYDPSRPFFEQLKELQEKAPVQSLFLHYQTIVNSDYNNLAGYLKECYMVFHADHDERCMYASGLKICNDSMDGLMLQKSDLCYECVNITKGYRNFYSVDCEECSDIYFSKNCTNCQNCVGCVNLRNKQYCIFNQQFTKADYEAELKKLDLSHREGIKRVREQAREVWLAHPQKYMHSRNNSKSTGDYIYNSKNTFASYEMVGAEDCKYCQFASTKVTKDCYDYTEYGENTELIYEALLLGDGVANAKFTVQGISNVRDVEYCYGVAGSAHLFGCVGLNKKEYCILNKQYSKEEYEKLVPKIREQMMTVPYTDAHGRVYKYGEFFPPELSSFGYNESTAQEFFPLDEKEAGRRGYSWRPLEEKGYQPTKKWNELPETIGAVDNSITKEIILCEAWDNDERAAADHHCTKAFRILPQELAFYKKMNIPLPTLCPNSRHYERTKIRNPLRLWSAQCACAGAASKGQVYANTAKHFHGAEQCPNEFETSYARDRAEIVYCEQCYQSEVV